MSDDDLLAKLRGLGVDADREKLAELYDGALSAEQVVSERFGLHDLGRRPGLDLPDRTLAALVAGKGKRRSYRSAGSRRKASKRRLSGVTARKGR
jgi:hypothetical protein